jgi:hypothetical protein
VLLLQYLGCQPEVGYKIFFGKVRKLFILRRYTKAAQSHQGCGA